MHDFGCMDCAIDTLETGEYYMLIKRIWNRIHDSYDGMLCIGCVEQRIGRELRPADFARCPLNTDQFKRHQSPRLRSRLKGKIMNDLTIQLTPTQGEAVRVLAERDAKLAKTIASRPGTQSYLLLRIHNKTEARAVTKHMRSMIGNLTHEPSGPSVKMAYALDRHVSTIKNHFEV